MLARGNLNNFCLIEKKLVWIEGYEKGIKKQKRYIKHYALSKTWIRSIGKKNKICSTGQNIFSWALWSLLSFGFLTTGLSLSISDDVISFEAPVLSFSWWTKLLCFVFPFFPFRFLGLRFYHFISDEFISFGALVLSFSWCCSSLFLWSLCRNLGGIVLCCLSFLS